MAKELELQIAYANELEAKGFDYAFAVGEAFVESMRNTHYKHTGTALDEIIDNALEAGANTISLSLGYPSSTTNKPNAIAIYDNGHGMPKNMLRPAAAWGGTHRHQSPTRTGMGRFGFGLPSASVNQARRFTIFSKVSGNSWYALAVDLDDVANGKYTDSKGKIQVPKEHKEEPPKWVQDDIKKNMPGKKIEHGTIVLWEKLDRLRWSTTKGMRDNLLRHFGMIYRNYLRQTQIIFDGTKVTPLDPLFITSGARFFDEDEDRALPLEPAELRIKSKLTDKEVTVTVRYAAMPAGFFSVDKDKAAQGKNQLNRMRIATDNNGILVCRMGRQIDVVDGTPWTEAQKFGNDDRYWGIEIDFPADLDEEFTIANSKQGVIMSERIWDHLENAGIRSGIKSLRKMYDESKKQKKAGRDTDPKVPRPSERSMQESEKFENPKIGSNSEERENQARKIWEQSIKKKARENSISEDEARKQAEEEADNRPYKVEYKSLPGAPFYRVEQRGGMKILEINMAHRFFSDIYANPAADAFMRAGLEVMLFSLGECELDAIGNQDKESFYHVEKLAWSKRLHTALGVLETFADDVEEDDTEAA